MRVRPIEILHSCHIGCTGKGAIYESETRPFSRQCISSALILDYTFLLFIYCLVSGSLSKVVKNTSPCLLLGKLDVILNFLYLSLSTQL